jgi:beta-glucanase (GH16 family)
MPNQDWQRWRIVWDRTPGDWRAESIAWYMNDQQFHYVRGDQINDQAVWESLTAKPLFFILNVAVGGNWVSTYRAYIPMKTAGASMLMKFDSLVIPTVTPWTAMAP